MSEFQRIGSFLPVFANLELDQYLAKNPPPVLLQDITKGVFRMIGGKSGETAELLLEADSQARESAESNLSSVPRETAYLVASLKSRLDTGATRLIIGSSAACDIIVGDDRVSPQHAHIQWEGGVYYLEDNNSENGTWLDASLLKPGQVYRLNPGDLIVIGGTDLIFLDPAGFYHFVRRYLGVQGTR